MGYKRVQFSFGARSKKLILAIWAQKHKADCRNCYAQRKKLWNCEGKSKPVEKDFFGHKMTLSHCPVKLISSNTNHWISAYNQYKNGFLPHGQGWLNESLKFIHMMGIIDNLLSQIEETELQKIRNSKNNGNYRP